jgi:hypothetical protein
MPGQERIQKVSGCRGPRKRYPKRLWRGIRCGRWRKHDEALLKIGQSRAQQTRIYVLRDPETFSELAHPAIQVDDQSVGDLAPARYLFVDRAPGQHVVSVSLLQNYYPITLTTRQGSVHYVHLGLRPYMERFLTAGLLTQAIEHAATGHNGAYMLVEMSEPDGRALLQRLTAGAG